MIEQVKRWKSVNYCTLMTIFCEAKADQNSFVTVVLIVFEAVSGRKVSWGKSRIFPIKTVNQIQVLANILGCRADNLPTRYLRMPLGNRGKELRIWDGIV